MSIQGINNATNVTQLRLVQPTQPVPQTPSVQQTQPAHRIARDSYDFQSVREAQLPRMSLTPAHQRLEKLRDLIAAKTDVPIYFEESGTPGSSAATNNPYGRAYLKFPVNAADRNAAATDSQIP